MAQLDFPTSPTPGQVYAAPNGVNYTWDNSIGIGVWTAAAGTPLSISNPGTISGSAQVNGVLSYTTGTATDGVPPYGYTWQWKKASDNSVLASNTANYTIPPALLGDRIYVELTATDAASATATATTPNYPAPPAVIDPVGVTNAVVPSTIPGTASFTWADGPQNLTATGCVEFSVDGGVSFGQGPTAVSNGNTVITQWIDSAPCGQAANGTTITGTLTDGTNTSSFSFTINRVPGSFSLAPNTESTTPSTITANDPSFTLTGGNTAPLVWGVLTGGGSTPQFSIDGGTTWVNLPSVPTAGISVPQGVATIVRFTTSAAAGTETLDVFAGASTTAGEYQSALFTVTVASSPFPNSSFTPAGAPNASPASVSTGSLHGTATCASWADGSVSLTSTGGIVFDVNATGTFGAGPTSIVPGDSLAVIWDPAVIAGAADGAILNGTLTDGVYTNTYSLTVSRAVTGLAFTDLTNQALSTAVTSNVITPTGFNVPVSLSYVGSTNAMTAIGVAVGGGGFLASPQTVNPGQTLQVQGTTGGTISTPYGVVLTMGSGPVATDTWTATTVAATPAVTTPSISTPGNNSTNVGTPSGITITSSAYAASGGAGTHASSDWELYANSYPLTSTNKITGVSNASLSWTTVSSTLPNTSWNMDYVSGAFYTGQGTDVYRSTNGTAWALTTSGGTGNVTGGFATDGTTIVGGTSSQVIVSTNNGTSWVARSVPPGGGNFRQAAYGNGVFIVANQTASGANSVARSTDSGATWNTATVSNNPDSLFGAAYGNGLFVVCGANALYTSATGASSSWTNRSGSVTAGTYRSVVWSGTQFVTVGDSGLIATSPDGVTWTNRTSGTTDTLFEVTYANGVYAASTSGSNVIFSADGITWTSSATGGGTSLRGIAGANGLWVVGGGNGATGIIQTSPAATTTLTIANCQTEGFLAGDTVISDPAAGGPATILSLDNSQVTVTSSTGWLGNSTQSLKRDPASYSLASSATADTVNLVSWPVAKPPLAANTTYYVRVRYTSNATVVTSDWSGWSEFTTGGLVPAIGALFGGGYFAGQINDGGTIYNLVVAPVKGDATGPNPAGTLEGQYGGSVTVVSAIAYKSFGPFTPNSSLAQNSTYGRIPMDNALTAGVGAGAIYPMFDWCANNATGPNAGTYDVTNSAGSGVGGFNDWYIPAKNELAVLYFFLKPNTTANNTSSGNNPDSVSPYTPSTNYGAGFPNVTTADGTGGTGNFLAAQGQSFYTTGTSYWSATEITASSQAWSQTFGNGFQDNSSGYGSSNAARAIRRVAA